MDVWKQRLMNMIRKAVIETKRSGRKCDTCVGGGGGLFFSLSRELDLRLEEGGRLVVCVEFVFLLWL